MKNMNHLLCGGNRLSRIMQKPMGIDDLPRINNLIETQHYLIL